MITLEEFNRIRSITENIDHSNEPIRNGIACPKCAVELLDSHPEQILLSYPAQKDIHCEQCGYKGYRLA